MHVHARQMLRVSHLGPAKVWKDLDPEAGVWAQHSVGSYLLRRVALGSFGAEAS